MSLEYEPASEPLHISAKQLFWSSPHLLVLCAKLQGHLVHKKTPTPLGTP